MNLRKTLLAEHSKKQATKIVNWVGDDQRRFDELAKTFLHDEYRVVQRAAWPMSYCVLDHPHLVSKWFAKMIDRLEAKGVHDAVIRNTFRFLQDIDIPEKYQGKLVNIAYKHLLNSSSPIAVKVFAMSTIANIARSHPELYGELASAIRELMKEGSGAIIARGKMILKQMDKQALR